MRKKEESECWKMDGNFMLEISLPYPPVTGNAMWRHAGKKHYLTDAAREYYRAVSWKMAVEGKIWGIEAKIAVRCRLTPSDNRKRDLENCWKVVADALTKAGVWKDDSLVRKLELEWMPAVRGGAVEIEIFAY